MASIAGLENITLPQLRKMDEEDARQLRNYLYQLNEQLKYLLTNIDEENLAKNLREKRG